MFINTYKIRNPYPPTDQRQNVSEPRVIRYIQNLPLGTVFEADLQGFRHYRKSLKSA